MTKFLFSTVVSCLFVSPTLAAENDGCFPFKSSYQEFSQTLVSKVSSLVALSKEDYQKYADLLLYALENITDVMADAESERVQLSSEETLLLRELRPFVEGFRASLLRGQIPLAMAAEKMGAEFWISLVSVGLSNGNNYEIFAFGNNFWEDYFNDPDFIESSVLGIVRVYSDHLASGPQSDQVVTSKRRLFRSNSAKALYLKLVSSMGGHSLSPISKTLLNAFGKGENSSEWIEYLSSEQGVDLDYLEKFENYRINEVPKLSAANLSEPFKKILIPQEQLLRAELLPFVLGDRDLGQLPQDRRNQLKRVLRRVEAYVRGFVNINDAVMATNNEPTLGDRMAQLSAASAYEEIRGLAAPMLKNQVLLDQIEYFGKNPSITRNPDYSISPEGFFKWRAAGCPVSTTL